MICLRTMCFAICVIFMILRIWCVVLHALKATPHHCWMLFWHNRPQSFCHFINTDTGISDFHNLTGVISKAYAPQSNRRTITYRSMKNFNQSNFSRDIDLIPLHVCEIFDDVNDVAWAQQNLLSSCHRFACPCEAQMCAWKSGPLHEWGVAQSHPPEEYVEN